MVPSAVVANPYLILIHDLAVHAELHLDEAYKRSVTRVTYAIDLEFYLLRFVLSERGAKPQKTSLSKFWSTRLKLRGWDKGSPVIHLRFLIPHSLASSIFGRKVVASMFAFFFYMDSNGQAGGFGIRNDFRLETETIACPIRFTHIPGVPNLRTHSVESSSERPPPWALVRRPQE